MVLFLLTISVAFFFVVVFFVVCFYTVLVMFETLFLNRVLNIKTSLASLCQLIRSQENNSLALSFQRQIQNKL